jgi:hypothetical protein
LGQHGLKRINITGKPPLTDNKTLLYEPKKGIDMRQSELKGNFSNSSIKTSNRIKSILATNNDKKTKEMPSRPIQTMATEHYEKPSSKPSTATQKNTDTLVQRLFNKDSKKSNTAK